MSYFDAFCQFLSILYSYAKRPRDVALAFTDRLEIVYHQRQLNVENISAEIQLYKYDGGGYKAKKFLKTVFDGRYTIIQHPNM